MDNCEVRRRRPPIEPEPQNNLECQNDPEYQNDPERQNDPEPQNDQYSTYEELMQRIYELELIR